MTLRSMFDTSPAGVHHSMAPALLWEFKRNNLIQCHACHRECLIPPGKTGFCRVRKHLEVKGGGKGSLASLNYGKTMGMPIDPIEKKPLFHFKPGSLVTSISTYGCNFTCRHCQNYLYSQEWTQDLLDRVPYTSPEEIVEFSLSNGAAGISYTYTEPTIFFEYALDTMKLAKEKGLYNVWVSNGYMTEKLLEYVKPFLDGINIDLKGNARFYKEVCGHADIKFVKENIAWCHENKLHLEVTNLIIPGYNDKAKDFKEVSEFMAGLSQDIPLHFTRFFPAYKMNQVPPTEAKVLEKAKKAAEKAGMRYVYLGNLGDEENTRCPECNSVLVKRRGYFAEKEHLNGNKCAKCGFEAYLVP